jgi:hypothetical protein
MTFKNEAFGFYHVLMNTTDPLVAALLVEYFLRPDSQEGYVPLPFTQGVATSLQRTGDDVVEVAQHWGVTVNVTVPSWVAHRPSDDPGPVLRLHHSVQQWLRDPVFRASLEGVRPDLFTTTATNTTAT